MSLLKRRYTSIAKTLVVLGLTFLSFTVARAQQPPQKDLADKSLDDLMNTQVTSVSKKEQRLFQAAAAVYVITQEDIRRSGLSSIPELLRTVPGLTVAQISANTWAVSARGFNGQFANKMLVLIDGRSIYSADFSGVYWGLQDVLLEDIDRIEIIRGPGATIWGSNAVNGVINITTKRAGATQGGLATASTGNGDYGIGGIRYGGKIGENAYYRAYGKFSNRSEFQESDGSPATDAWRSVRGGFRSDWQINNRDALTVQGDLSSSRLGNTSNQLVSIAPPLVSAQDRVLNSSSGNIMARWERVISPKSDIELQFYYDHFNYVDTLFDERRSTIDFDFTHHILAGNRHDIVWGAGYRRVADKFRDVGLTVSLDPNQRTQQIANAFIQDEITVVENRLRLTVGSKFEHDSYSGFNAQPSVRLAWTPTDRQTVWAAASRAVRTPSRGDENVELNNGAFPGANNLTNLVTIFGNPNFKPETVNAYELGYRLQATSRVSFDVASFYNVYQRLEDTQQQTPFFSTDPVPHVAIPVLLTNTLSGKTYGTEISANWNVITRWKITAGYSWLRTQLNPDSSSLSIANASLVEGSNPHHQIQLQSNLSLPHRLEFDTSLYYVDKLPGYQIPGYVRLDLRFGWRIAESLDFSIGGQNLLNARHEEFGTSQTVNSTFVKRTAYGKITWRF